MPFHLPRALPVAAVVAAACAGLLAGCSGSSTASSSAAPGPPSSGPVRVAVEGPLTGTQAPTGQDMVRGARLAADQLNAAGGVLGRQVQIVPEDDRATAAAGAAAAHRAVASRIAAVVGPFNSSVGVTALPVYRSAGVSILRLTSATVTEGYGVTTQPMADQIAPVEARELSGILHVSSVAILYDPSTYTASIARQLTGLLGRDGIKVPVNLAVAPTAGASTVRADLARVAAASPQVTYLAMYGQQAGTTVSEMADGTGAVIPSYGRCFVDLAAQGPAFVQAAGVVAPASCLASGVPDAAQLPGGAAYVAAYRSAFHSAPGTWGPFAYDSVKIWAAAAARAHQVFGPTVRSDLAATAGYRGATGTVAFLAPSGNRQDPPVVVLGISPAGQYLVDSTWANDTGYSG